MNTSRTKEEEKKQLWRIMGVSAIIDIATTSGTIASLGLGVIVEELIENAVSQFNCENTVKLELSALDNAIGLLPIPGVTAVTVHCARKLIMMRFQTSAVKV